jgi:hypothetical protein
LRTLVAGALSSLRATFSLRLCLWARLLPALFVLAPRFTLLLFALLCSMFALPAQFAFAPGFSLLLFAVLLHRAFALQALFAFAPCFALLLLTALPHGTLTL